MVDIKPQNVPGFRAAGIHAGLKKDEALDMALIRADRNCKTAGVFTQNMVKAAPVLYNQQILADNAERIRAVVINTVSANASTGRVGLENARTMARLTAEQIECEPDQVLVLSTGVIGTQLPMEKIDTGIKRAADALGHHWEAAAEAIMTTDTRPKWASRRVFASNGQYTITGITKGSGMIAPNMATTLGVIVTDARLTLEQVQQVLAATTAVTYNRIVVDGDTSPSDTVLLLANGASGVDMASEVDLQQFQLGLTKVMTDLAKAVVRDGEGATHFITLDVINAPSEAAADQIAHTIAASPLVKTAFFGSDANWGRIISAAGRAGVAFDPDAVRLWVAGGERLPTDDDDQVERGLLLYDSGTPATYDDDQANALFGQDATYITLDLGAGEGRAVVWTCDLSDEYIKINADYRT